jgi:hypothetical protein
MNKDYGILGIAWGFLFSAGGCFLTVIGIFINDLINHTQSNGTFLFFLLLFGWASFFISIAIRKFIK